ncbi:MAG: adenylate/guanylate cyclase domain-containing protein [Myxococcota bacterium]
MTGLAFAALSVVLGALLWRRTRELAAARRAAEDRGDALARALARHVSPQVAEVLARGGSLWTGRREVTVLFADLSGFTRYAEQVSAEAAVATLGTYLAELTGVALAGGGTLDKFMGDEVMVVFNAPVEQPDHAARALATARDMQLAMRLLNGERAAMGHPALELSVGINSGEAAVGPVGAEERFQYTAIGDAVNVAKRLQGQARPGEILVGARTMELARETGGPFEELALRGRAGTVRAARLAPPPTNDDVASPP